MPGRRRFVRRCSLDQPVAFLRERRVGFASASTVGASTLSAAADVLFLFSQASWTFAAMRPRVDTAKPLAAAHSRIAVVSWRSAGGRAGMAPTARSGRTPGPASRLQVRSEDFAKFRSVVLAQINLVVLASRSKATVLSASPPSTSRTSVTLAMQHVHPWSCRRDAAECLRWIGNVKLMSARARGVSGTSLSGAGRRLCRRRHRLREACGGRDPVLGVRHSRRCRCAPRTARFANC
jgi:hypothetical protein